MQYVTGIIAPKGRSDIAQGNALGKKPHNRYSSNGASSGRLEVRRLKKIHTKLRFSIKDDELNKVDNP
jgi:hypothetical protein